MCQVCLQKLCISKLGDRAGLPRLSWRYSIKVKLGNSQVLIPRKCVMVLRFSGCFKQKYLLTFLLLDSVTDVFTTEGTAGKNTEVLLRVHLAKIIILGTIEDN